MSNRKRRRRPPTRPHQPDEGRSDLSLAPAVRSAAPTQPTPALTPQPNAAAMATAIVEAVESGAVDAHLRPVGAAIRRRQRQLARKVEVDAAARFEVGDAVRIGSEVRPKYLHGAAGVVSGWAQKNVLVRLDHPRGRYPAGTDISVSPLGVHRI